MKYSLATLILVYIHTVDVLAQEQGPTSVEVLTKVSTSWNGDVLPSYPDGAPEITIDRVAIAGNTTLPWHKHPVINAGVILSGRLTVVTKDGQEIRLVAGDAVVETVETWHQGINEYPEPVEIIVFYAGVRNEPVTIVEE